MVRVKVLGTGSTGNCYVLECNGQKLLLDCGLTFKDIKVGLDFNISGVVGCFISHGHTDHVQARKSLEKTGIPMFAPYEDTEHKTASFMAGGYKIVSFPLPHDGTENRGCIIICPDGTKVLYATDFEYCKYSFRKQEINLFLVECNYQAGYISAEDTKRLHVLRGHCELLTLTRFLVANVTDSCKGIMLIHLSKESCDPVEVKDAVCEKFNNIPVWIAEKGVEIAVE